MCELEVLGGMVDDEGTAAVGECVDIVSGYAAIGYIVRVEVYEKIKTCCLWKIRSQGWRSGRLIGPAENLTKRMVVNLTTKKHLLNRLHK